MKLMEKKENYLKAFEKIIKGTYGSEFSRDEDGKLIEYKWIKKK